MSITQKVVTKGRKNIASKTLYKGGYVFSPPDSKPPNVVCCDFGGLLGWSELYDMYKRIPNDMLGPRVARPKGRSCSRTD